MSRLLLVVSVLTAAPLSALAQGAPAPPADPGAAAAAPTARERIAAGDKLQRLHLYEAALAEYQKAYELTPSASTLKRIADTQRDLHDAADATASYEKLLTLPDLTRDDRRAAERALKTLETESGAVAVSATVEGAGVSVDGHSLGVTPLAKPVRVAVGAHIIRVTKDGFEPFTAEIKVTAGASTAVDARLAAEVRTGSVLVREKGNRTVRIAIDGRPAGTTPYLGELSPGEHSFELAEAKMTSLRLTVNIVAKQRTAVVLEGTDTVGTLKIDSQPPNAEISVDGKPIAAGTREVELPFGHHQVSAQAQGYNVVTENVDIVNAKGASWSVRLQKVVAAPTAKVDDDSGGHFDVALAGTFPLHSHVAVCPPDAGTKRTCDEGTRLGGGLLLRGGYNFGVIGIDLTGLAFVDQGEDTVDYPGGVTVTSVPEASSKHTQKYQLLDVGGVVAIGPTATSHGETVRVTGGIAAGVGVRLAAFRRTLSGGLNDELLNTNVSVGPAGIAHVSLLLGSTPGAKLEVGLMLVVDKQSYTTDATQRTVNGVTGSANTSVPAYDVLKDVQIYLGPTLGGRFGY